MFGQISLLAGGAVFFPTVQLLDFGEVTCKYGLPQKNKLTINDRLLCMLVCHVVLDYMFNSLLDMMIAAVPSFVDITLIFNIILIFLIWVWVSWCIIMW